MAKSEEFNFGEFAGSFLDDVNQQIGGKIGTSLNVIEFAEQELNLGITLYPQQKTILKLFYGLELDIVEQSIVDFWSFDKKLTYQKNYEHQGLALGLGRRASKSLLASIVVAYEFYKLCILESPQEHYEISRTSWIGILVLATTATQSKDTIFGSVIGTFQNCAFFKRLEAKGDLFIGTEYITLKSKLITIKSGNSKSAAQVGGNLICLVMDEFALFTSDSEESNAMHLWSSLGISLSPFGYHGKRLALSSAICDGDAIEQLINMGKNDDTLMTLEACSWEINPKSHPDVNPITRSEYALNPKTAALHYENKRTGSEEAFLTYEEIIQAHIGTSVISAVNNQIEVVSQHDPTVVNLLTAVEILHLEPAAPGIKTFLHLDASVKKDNYALAFGHVYFNNFTNSNSLVIDGYIVWEPTIDAPVYFENVFNIIVEIHKKRPIYMLSADQYAGSAETMQKIKNYGIKTKIINFGNNQQVIMYNVLNNYLHERKITLPQTGIWKDLLLRELKNVLLIKNGAVIKVDHPKGNYLTKTVDAEGNEVVIVDAHSKDIADCVSSIAWNTVTEKLITSTNQNIQIGSTQPKTSHTTQTVTDRMGHAPPTPLSLGDRYKTNKSLIRNIKTNKLFN